MRKKYIYYTYVYIGYNICRYMYSIYMHTLFSIENRRKIISLRCVLLDFQFQDLTQWIWIYLKKFMILLIDLF